MSTSTAIVTKERFDSTNEFYLITKATAENELRKIDEEIPEKLKQMEAKIKSELPNLECKIDNAFLMRFLHPAKCDVDRAVLWIKGYYDFKKSYSFMFQNALPSTILGILKDNLCMYPLPYRDSKGHLLCVCKPGNFDFKNVPIEEYLRAISLLVNYCMNSEISQINGVVIFCEWTNFSFWHLRHFPLKYIFMLAKAVQGAYPVRIKGIHHLNEPAAFKILFSLIKQFLKEKLIKRIHLHGSNFSKVHDKFDPKILPNCLGGKLSEENIKRDLFEDVNKYEDYFKDCLSHGFK